MRVPVCVCARTRAPRTAGADLKTASPFPHLIKTHKALVCSEETQVQTIVMKLVDAGSQPPSNF